MFTVTPQMGVFNEGKGKGFKITFSNNVTISIQFGEGNYCDNSNRLNFDIAHQTICKNAEIAIWKAGGDWITKKAYVEITGEELYDDVIGDVTPDEAVNYIMWAASYPG